MTRKHYEQPTVICLGCGHLREHEARGLCHPCYGFHIHAETIDQYPLIGTHLSHLWRMQDYVELRAQHLTKKQIAVRLGVTVRSVERYIAKHNAQQAQEAQQEVAA
jgi:DNA-binding CsgD family transcriptional regulator